MSPKLLASFVSVCASCGEMPVSTDCLGLLRGECQVLQGDIRRGIDRDVSVILSAVERMCW